MPGPTPPPLKSKFPKQRQIVVGSVAVGAGYGLLIRFISGMHGAPPFAREFGVMTLSFVAGMPFALGFLTVWSGERRRRLSWAERVVLPWAASAAFLGGCLALLWEGLICVVLLLPILLVLSSLGGVIAGLIIDFSKGSGTKNYCAAFLAVLPLVAAPIEKLRHEASEIRTVQTQIDIRADRRTVWNQIRSVPLIREDEQSFDWSHAIGFPRPLEATLRGEGLGAVRYATFEHGVLFVETITDWQVDRRLEFSIHADTKNIPPTTFDEHVRVGGEYFDVLSGCYRIEDLGNGIIRLHLSSDQRLSTRFNVYSHLWTEWLMADLQNYILKIIKRRCEAGKGEDRLAALAAGGGRLISPGRASAGSPTASGPTAGRRAG